jgi:hypothetical protein
MYSIETGTKRIYIKMSRRTRAFILEPFEKVAHLLTS